MPALTQRIALLAALSVFAFSQAAVARDSSGLDYHGWHVDASHAADQPREAVTTAVQKQLDNIETLGIAQDIVAFMRKVPLRVDASRDASVAAHYDRTTGIDFRLDALNPKKPVLLHELLRAFHEQKLGYNENTIIKAFESARDSGAWPADASMMRSAQDFFADTATVYLYGTIDTPPFTQGRLHELQPEYWKWLGEVFDGFRGCE